MIQSETVSRPSAKTSRPPSRATARRRRLGQHFLTDRQAIARLVEAIAPGPRQRLVEIGPGRGALTLPLAERAGRLLAVEKDQLLAETLRRGPLGRMPGVAIVEADILSLQPKELQVAVDPSPGRAQRIRVVGNLPYRISTRILAHLLPAGDVISDSVFMLQQEVARRAAAAAGHGEYGALSVLVQLHSRPEPLLDLGPRSFTPPPEVSSSVVRFTLRRPPRTRWRAGAARLAVAAFAHRRKTVGNSLRQAPACILPAPLAEALEKAGIDAGRRPQELAPEDYLRLCRCLDWPGENR